MSEEDIWVTDSVHRDIDRDIKEIVTEMEKGISAIEWWDICIGTVR